MIELRPWPGMSPEEFRQWRQRLGMKKTDAMAALGIARSTLDQYETGVRRDGRGSVEIPRHIALACTAIAYGLPPIGTGPVERPRDTDPLLED